MDENPKYMCDICKDEGNCKDIFAHAGKHWNTKFKAKPIN